MTAAPPGVLEVRLSRPEKRNALDTEACEQLLATFEESPPPERRCYLLYGEGEAFCAGADLGQIRAQGGEGRFGPIIDAVYRRVREQPLPVVAWLNGAAIGGGCILALMCDFRLAAPSARMGIPASRLGIALGPGLVELLAAEAGPAVARLLLLPGRTLDSPELLRLGLVHGVAETHDVAARWAADLASAAPLSVAAHRRAIQGNRDEARALAEKANRSDDLRAGLEASARGDPPEFRGS